MNEIYLYKKEISNKKVLNVGMAYPSTYYYGMSVLGFLSMFKAFDQNERVAAQRIFLNSKSLAFDPKYLDILGFSFVFEFDIFQILKILKKYNLKLYSKDRIKKTPLIFSGGPVVTSNPEPFAEFFDFLIIGDGEDIADEITEVYLKNKNKSKQELLIELSKIEGIYVPSLYKVLYDNDSIKRFYPIVSGVSRRVNKRISSSKKCLYSPIISEDTYYSNTVFIELVRGCPFACKFCSAYWHNLPARNFEFKYIKKAVKKASKYAKKIVFIGAMITAHPDFEELCIYLKKLKEKRDFTVEFSSLSFEYPSKYAIELSENNSVMLSIECGSEKLRKSIGKNLSDEKINETLKYYISKGAKKFSLYYMIGLPGETDADIDTYISSAIKMAKTFPEVEFGHIISTFTPKPATPFEQEKRKPNVVLKEYINKIKSVFDDNNIEYVLPYPDKDAFSALLALGDRRLAGFIKYAFEKNVPISNMFKEYRKFMKKMQNIENGDILPHYSKYIYTRKTEKQLLPWSFIKFS